MVSAIVMMKDLKFQELLDNVFGVQYYPITLLIVIGIVLYVIEVIFYLMIK